VLPLETGGKDRNPCLDHADGLAGNTNAPTIIILADALA